MKKHKKITFCLIYLLRLIIIIYFANLIIDVQAEVVDRVVSEVNNDIITLYDLNQAVQPYISKIKKIGYSYEQERKMLYKVRNDILSKLIDEKLTQQEIKRLKITIDKNHIDGIIENVKTSNYLTDEELRKELAKEGLTLQQYRKQLEKQVLKTKLVNLVIKSKIIITKDEIKSYYENNKANYLGKKQYHLKAIIMKVPPFADNLEKQKILKKMELLHMQLKEGQPFESIANKYSEVSSSQNGGYIGIFELNELSSKLKNAIKNMKSKEFTSVIDTDQGYQILYVHDITKTPDKPVKQVTLSIEKKLLDKRIDNKFKLWLKKLRQKSHIRIIK